MNTEIIEKLTLKDDKVACAYTDDIVFESQKNNNWYMYFDEFASLLDHPKSLVRNRTLSILAANAKWDNENKFESIIDEYLLHVVDEKPITSRCCIKKLVEVGQAKPNLIPIILDKLNNADLSKYKDSMRQLIEKDIIDTLEKLKDIRTL